MSTSETYEEKIEMEKISRPMVGLYLFIGGIIALILSIMASISLGAADIDFKTVWNSIFHYNEDVTAHQVIQEVRLPRVLGAAVVGSCFAVSGAVMQGMTRNPLADSGLLGLNAGAGFVLALCFAFLPGLSYSFIILFSFLGATIGAGLVFGVGSLTRNGLTPMRLVLAGAAVSSLFIALSEGIAIYFNVSQDLAFWYAGGVSGAKWYHLKIITPIAVVALASAWIISRSITMISLGEEVAVGLGQRTKVVKMVGMMIVLVLAGTAVSVVGGVGFVGLIIPHITRAIVGHDYRWIIPNSMVYGGLLLVLADLAARTLNAPYETPIGALIGVIGVPFFLYIARKGGKEL
ncbi:FecCD family ABC transporter permease [Pontibacillus litoralis]|uniref:Ferrichrome ABC transporter permease n=1 Tax=Pontibacillus litoralis JSM 072002 TaxID=1385512 RepID=A0A0A5HX54_9BACI|nr:iron ABC transporter permease [Pontibacillus litoralis]KGX88212.1 ferrichrome ABC transporter permease [Pontibacillus litoralis JSM 072002]